MVLLFLLLSIVLLLSFFHKSTSIMSICALLSIVCILFIGERSIMLIVSCGLLLFCLIIFILIKEARYDVLIFAVFLCLWLGFIFLFFHLYIRINLFG